MIEHSSEVVQYHNDFYKVSLGSLSALEQNLLFGVLVNVKERGESLVKFSVADLSKFIDGNYTADDIDEITKSLREKFFKIDFAYWIYRGDLKYKYYVNLFRHFGLVYKDNKLIRVEFKVDDEFAYILNNFTKDYTTLELSELLALGSKYSKTLYRLLMRFKQTGFMQMSWDEFSRQMGIPKSYRQSEIDKFILKPSVKELSEATLFFRPFKNLKCEKIKSGRGGAVKGVQFTFDVQCATKDRRPLKLQVKEAIERNAEYVAEYAKVNLENLNLKQENEAIKQKNLDLQTENFKMQIELKAPKMLSRCDKLCDLQFIKFDKYRKPQRHRINKIAELKNGLSQIFFRVEIINCDNNQTWEKDFDSLKHIINYVRKNENVYRDENALIMQRRGFSW